MKASELIYELQEMIEKHGDTDVCVREDRYAYSEVYEDLEIGFEDYEGVFDSDEVSPEEYYIMIKI